MDLRLTILTVSFLIQLFLNQQRTGYPYRFELYNFPYLVINGNQYKL